MIFFMILREVWKKKSANFHAILLKFRREFFQIVIDSTSTLKICKFLEILNSLQEWDLRSVEWNGLRQRTRQAISNDEACSSSVSRRIERRIDLIRCSELLVNIGLDTAENEPPKVSGEGRQLCVFWKRPFVFSRLSRQNTRSCEGQTQLQG